MASPLAPTSRRKMSGAIHQSDGVRFWGRPMNCQLNWVSEARPVHPRPALVASTEALSVWSCGERGSPAGPKCGWFRGKLILSPSMTSEDSTTQFSILPGRQSRISNAYVIQVRQKVANFEMFPQGEAKDEKKKLGECKAEIQLRTVRRLRFSWDCTKHEEIVSFFSIQPTIGRVSTPRRASRSSRPSPRSPTTFPTTSSTTTGTGRSRTRAMYVKVNMYLSSIVTDYSI